MVPIHLLKPVVFTVRDEVFKKFNPKHINITVYDHVATHLSKIFPDADNHYKERNKTRKKNPWESRIRTMLGNLPGKEINTDKDESYFTFILLCIALGIEIDYKVTLGNKTIYTYDLEIRQIILLLEKGEKLPSDVVNKQLQELPKDHTQSEKFDIYNCFYSMGGGKPGKATLKLFFDTHHAKLSFDEEDEILYSGNLRITEGQIFIYFNEPEDQKPLFLYLKKKGERTLELSTSFKGVLCRSPVEESDTAAMKVTVRKITTTSENDQLPKTQFELFRQTIELKSRFDFKILEEYVGTYYAYWLSVSEHFSVNRSIFTISDDGSCTMIGPRGESLFGFVSEINTTQQMLKCVLGINMENASNYLNIVIDLSTKADGFCDGVYSGHKTDFYLFAGKLRAYRALDENLLPTEQIAHPDLIQKLPELGQTLVDFFIGRTKDRSSKFIHPNDFSFNNWFNPMNIKSNVGIANYEGDFMILRLDSNKKVINRYKMHIKNGYITGTLNDINGSTIRYWGKVTYLAPCLMINLYKRNGADYDALYIVHVFGRRATEKAFYNGVFATTTSNLNPICGRAIMFKAEEEAHYSPIPVYSAEYHTFNQTHDNALNLLTGFENNIIKVNKHENDLNRIIDYGSLFFIYACTISDDLQKGLYLRFALDHGFSDMEQLEKALVGPLSLLNDKITRNKDSWNADLTHVTFKYKDKTGRDMLNAYQVIQPNKV